jgi:vancomycin permeability regulator SanA
MTTALTPRRRPPRWKRADTGRSTGFRPRTDLEIQLAPVDYGPSVTDGQEKAKPVRARVILISGDGGGESGDEPAVMATYLTGLGIDPRRIVADPHGLDTYDTCVRAREVYGVTRALVVTQAYHLSRAVTLCRRVGIDADGVTARCGGCATSLLVGKAVRDYFASGKAAWDAVRARPPAVTSSPNAQVRDALRTT